MTADEFLDADDDTLSADSSAATPGLLTARTTTYFPGERNSDPDTDAGRTSTGGPLTAYRPGMAGTVAVDPAKHPYGTIFRRPDGSVYVAADTGGAVKSMKASGGRADVLDFASPTPIPDYQTVQVIPPTADYARLSPAGKEAYHRQAAAMATPSLGTVDDFLDAPTSPAPPTTKPLLGSADAFLDAPDDASFSSLPFSLETGKPAAPAVTFSDNLAAGRYVPEPADYTTPEISAPPSIADEIRNGNIRNALHRLYEPAREQFSGLIGPTEEERFNQSVPFGKNPDGSTKYEYKPLGDRLDREQGLMTPYIPVPHLDSAQDDSTATAIGKGVFNTLAGVAGGFESPLGAMLPAAGQVPAASRAVSGLFAADMASNLPDQVKQAVNGSNLQERVEGGLGAAVGAVMAGGALKHAVTAAPLGASAQNPDIPRSLSPEQRAIPADETQSTADQTPASQATGQSGPATATSGNIEPSEPEESRAASPDFTPVFAPGATPQERADAFLQPPDEGDHLAPTAVRFAPGEEIPAELGDTPRVETPDGATVFYDPGQHSAEDFSPTGTPEQSAPQTSRPARQSPRTPEELRPLRDAYMKAMRTAFPGVAAKLEVIHQDAMDAFPGESGGGQRQAARIGDAIYLSARALRANPEELNHVNLHHEIAHIFEDILPPEQKAALRDQWQQETASGDSPLHRQETSNPGTVDPRALDGSDPDNFKEWFAERVAWENAQHFAGDITPHTARTPVGRAAARIRQLVTRVWRAIKPGMAPSDISAKYRQFLTKGIISNDTPVPGEAQFARRGTRENDPERTTLYRAADDPEARTGAHFTESEKHGRAYTDNPGFGGANLYRFNVDKSGMLDAPELRHLAKAYLDAGGELPRGVQFDEWDERPDEAKYLERYWHDSGFDRAFQVLENTRDVERALAKKYQWIRYPDDFPEGSTTWKYLGKDALHPEPKTPQFARRRAAPSAPEEPAIDEPSIRRAYRALVDQDGFRDVRISDLAAKSGVAPEKLGPWILDQARQGKESPTRGDWSLSRPQDKAAVVQLRGEPHLQVRLNDDASAVPPQSRAQPTGKAPGYREIQGSNGSVAGPAQFAIRAYHGTPHEVDKFSLDKIGTGEGAQVYGHGLYFAENPSVSEEYRKGLTEKDFIRKVREAYGEGDSPEDATAALKDAGLSKGQRDLVDALQKDDWLGFDYPHQAVGAALRDSGNYDLSPDTKIALNSFGNHYTVQLDVEPHELLDWDKPFSEQSDKVKTALQRWVKRQREWTDNDPDKMTGAEIYHEFGHSNTEEGKKFTSEDMLKVGIPGIRYLDQGSRGAGKGSHNYVMFDDSRIRITHRNGEELTPTQFAVRKAQEETPEFKRFFQDSKVTDDEGNPRTVFHGTPNPGFGKFRTKGKAAYFAENPDYTGNFSDAKGGTYPVYLSAKKPLDLTDLGTDPVKSADFGARLREAGVDTKGLPWLAEDAADRRTFAPWQYVRHMESLRKAIREAGYDSIKQLEEFKADGSRDGIPLNRSTAWAVFDPSQIKSATGNSGAFDAENPDIRFSIRNTAKAAKAEYDNRDLKDRIPAWKDAADTRASMIGRQAGHDVSLDFGRKKELADPKSMASRDLAAMPFVIEAGGDKAKLATELAKVNASKDPRLARDFAPVVQHAIDNFARLDAKKGNAEGVYAKQRMIERRHGIDTPEVENYVNRRLELPENRKALEPVTLFDKGGGSGKSRYFTKGRKFETLGDAISAGYRPKSTNLADLVQNRVETGQRIVQQRRLWNQLKGIAAPGDEAGRPILAQKISRGPLLNGKTELMNPPGYVTVPAGGADLVVHKQYAKLFRAQYGDSAIRGSVLGNVALNLAGLAKHGTLVFDTFHPARILAKELAFGYQAGYKRGLSLLEYNDRSLGRAVVAGDITQSQADYVRRFRPQADELLKAGLNVGRFADNLLDQSHNLVERIPFVGPGISKFNDVVFNQITRGAMLQTALTNFSRNVSRFPELSREQVARRTAKEMNEVFGNLGSQDIFTKLGGKTLQDLSRLVFLAPQWAESQVRAEVRGAGQALRAPLDAARGRLRVGTVAQGMASGIVATLLANQVMNYLSRGKPTWQNPEDDRKLDAFIPGGKRGFWFSPFEIFAETLHQALRLAARYENPMDTLTGFAANKLSPMARGLTELGTGRDYAGRPFLSAKDRVRSALVDSLPFPMPLNSLFEKDPRQTFGLRLSRQPGSIEKQVMQMVGLKTQNELSPRGKMFALAKPYRPDRAGFDSAGEYTELRRDLDNDQLDGAKDEVSNLVQQAVAAAKKQNADANVHQITAKKLQSIAQGLGITPGGGIAQERYTDSKEHEQDMLDHLTPAQRDIYRKAQQDHAENARKFERIAAGFR